MLKEAVAKVRRPHEQNVLGPGGKFVSYITGMEVIELDLLNFTPAV
jgi:hypothetical protein